MQIKKGVQPKSYAVKITAEENGEVIGRVYLYLIYNDLHEEPYGLLEDLYVAELYRGRGIGKQLIQAVIDKAKARGCYKLIGTSRDSRPEVHAMYERMGFKRYGVEFRMDFIDTENTESTQNTENN